MGWLLFLPFGSLYFIPTFVAMRRHHRNTVVIASVNIVLGWTIIGWAISLAWALSHNTRKNHVRIMTALAEPGTFSNYDRNRMPGL